MEVVIFLKGGVLFFGGVRKLCYPARVELILQRKDRSLRLFFFFFFFFFFWPAEAQNDIIL